MTDEQKVAFINAQVVCALAAIKAMEATNQERISSGHSLAYGEESFRQIQEDYVIGHDAVIDFFRN